MHKQNVLASAAGVFAVLGVLCGACSSAGDDSSFDTKDPGGSDSPPAGNGSDDMFGGAETPPLGGGDDGACASLVSEADVKRQPADIIIAIDTSGSMSDETAEVQENLNNFASRIAASGVDIQLVVIGDESVCIPAPLGSGTCAGEDTNLPKFRHVVQEVGSNDALQVILDTYPQWKDSLRPGASKTFAVVTDDNSDMTAAEFTSRMLALDPQLIPAFKFDAIATATDCDGISAGVGTVYQELVELTLGVFGDLCGQDFDPVFTSMATDLLSGTKIACDYAIPVVPDGSKFNPAQVNVSYSPSGGAAQGFGFLADGAAACGDLSTAWYYDNPASPQKILLCPGTCNVVQSDATGKVEIEFGCDTISAVPR